MSNTEKRKIHHQSHGVNSFQHFKHLVHLHFWRMLIDLLCRFPIQSSYHHRAIFIFTIFTISFKKIIAHEPGAMHSRKLDARYLLHTRHGKLCDVLQGTYQIVMSSAYVFAGYRRQCCSKDIQFLKSVFEKRLSSLLLQ